MVRLLRYLSKRLKRAGHVDRTAYGTGRHSTRAFFVHHLAEISAAVRLADALTLENKAAELSFVHINSARRTGVHTA